MTDQDSAVQGGNGHESPGEAARGAARRLRDDGADLYQTAKSAVVESAEDRKDEAGAYLRDVSDALDAGAEELERRGRGRTASWAGWLAGKMARVGGDVSQRGIGELWEDAEAFARRRPAVVAGAALLAGFGLVRFLMSAPDDGDYRDDHSQEQGHGG